MSSLLWDASAVLLILNQEPGWEGLMAELGEGAISSVNLCEVVSKLADSGLAESEVEEVLGALSLEVVPFSSLDARRAGILRPLTRHLGLSLGDRACLAAGMRLDRTILTADRAWRELEVGVEIRLAR